MAEGEQKEFEARVYEVGYHLVSSLPEEKVPAEVGAVKEALQNAGAAVISEEYPKPRPLSYPMAKSIAEKSQKFNSAYFGWIKFDADLAALEGLKAALTANEHILRFLIARTVREHTMSTPRFAPFHAAPPRDRTEKRESPEPKPALSEEELDKKIEQLIAE